MMPLTATWIGLEMVILTAVCQTEKEKYHMISLIMKSNFKNNINEITFKTERLRDFENTLKVTKQEKCM